MTCLVSTALPGLGFVLFSLGCYRMSRNGRAEGTGLAGLHLHALLPPSLPQSPQRPPLSPDLEDPLGESSSPGRLRPGTVVPWHSVLRAAIHQGRCGWPSDSPWSQLILPGPRRGQGLKQACRPEAPCLGLQSQLGAQPDLHRSLPVSTPRGLFPSALPLPLKKLLENLGSLADFRAADSPAVGSSSPESEMLKG